MVDDGVTESARKSTPSSGQRSEVEVVRRGERGRCWSEEDRARILTEAISPSIVASHVARRFGVSTGGHADSRSIVAGATQVPSASALSDCYARDDALGSLT